MKRSPAKVAARLVELALEQDLCIVDGVGIDLVDHGLTMTCAIRRGCTTCDEQRPMATISYDLGRARTDAEFRIATEALVTTACRALIGAPGIETRQ